MILLLRLEQLQEPALLAFERLRRRRWRSCNRDWWNREGLSVYLSL